MRGMVFRMLAAATAVGMALAGSTGSPMEQPRAGGPLRPFDLDPSDSALVAAVRLEQVESCDELHGRLQDLAKRVRGREMRWGRRLRAASSLGGGVGAGAVVPAMAPAAPMADAVISEPTGTNVQVAGVDEGDLVKTDGETLFVLRRGRLVAVDAATLDELDRIVVDEQRWGDSQMLLTGDRILVAQARWVRWYEDRIRITIVDISDPERLSIVSRTDVDGHLVAMRATAGTVRLVTTAWSPLRGPIRDLRLGDVLPSITVRRGGVAEARRVACDAVYLGRNVRSMDRTSVMQLDPSSGALVAEATTFAGDGVVYATPSSVYLAQRTWTEPRGATQIHRFDTTEPNTIRYVASGRVPGSPLSQWAMDEPTPGTLRIATTLEGIRATRWRSESQLAVLQQDGDVLRIAGSVDGLGRGETIQSVRYVGDTAYVVTFRQIDPLFVIDVADPTAPQVLGELKIPGFSAYLHPVADGRLLGVGQDANRNGFTRGAQVSLFDVHDPASPRRLSTANDLGSSSPVQSDHRAFQWIDDRQLAVVPTNTWKYTVRRELEERTVIEPGTYDAEPTEPAEEQDPAAVPELLPGEPEPTTEPEEPQARTRIERVVRYNWHQWTRSIAHIIRVDGDDLVPVHQINHRPLVRMTDRLLGRGMVSGSIERTIAIGDRLYAFSDAGITATDLDRMTETDRLIWAM